MVRPALLHELETDPAARARLVETLRYAAALLDGRPMFRDVDFAADQGRMTAERLLQVAAGLCDHARVEAGQCRHCESLQPEAG